MKQFARHTIDERKICYPLRICRLQVCTPAHVRYLVTLCRRDGCCAAVVKSLHFSLSNGLNRKRCISVDDGLLEFGPLILTPKVCAVSHAIEHWAAVGLFMTDHWTGNAHELRFELGRRRLHHRIPMAAGIYER